MRHTLLYIATLLCAWNLSAATPLETAQKVVKEVKAATAPDARQAVYKVTVTQGNDGTLVLKGDVSEQASYDALRAALKKANVKYVDSINVMPSDEWAQVFLSAISLRTEGRHAAEMSTQALMGMPLRVLSKGGEWWLVQTPDGYIAYAPSSSMVKKTPRQMADWRNADRVIVTAPYQTHIFTTPEANGLREVVSDVVLGNILVALPEEVQNGRMAVELPDGRKGYISTTEVEPFEKWAQQDFNPDRILDIAYSMEGTPYLWGGTSVKSLDCSGLAKVSYFSNGIILMRDASQQALTGTRIEAKDWRTCQPGDLLFFGNAKTGKVTHVAIYDHDGNYVHSSGRVKRNSVDPESPAYLTTPFLHAVRINGNEGTQGITRVRDHKWYF